MKKNVLIFARLLPVILILTTVTTACNRRPRWNTVLPGPGTRVSDEGPSGNPRGGNRTGSQNPDLSTNPLNSGAGNSNVPVVPVTPGQIETSGNISDFDMNEDRSRFATDTVYFDFDKAVVKPGEIDKIRTVASHLKGNATHKVLVEGHCDERGTEEYNRSLGERRAQAIREVLAREGVSPDRVRTLSFGEDKPADSGHNESAWTKNRRGEFVLLTPK